MTVILWLDKLVSRPPFPVTVENRGCCHNEIQVWAVIIWLPEQPAGLDRLLVRLSIKTEGTDNLQLFSISDSLEGRT